MDPQKLKFMLSIQKEIDLLSAKLGSDNQSVIQLKQQFDNLSEQELKPSGGSSIGSADLTPLKYDTEAIRSHLEIRANNSINYDFVNIDRVRIQLIRDNLKMENSRLDLSLKDDTERFYLFCVNAFYQIEELINYYYGTKYTFPDFINLISKKNGGKSFNNKRFFEITIAEKIFLFEGEFYFNNFDSNGKKIYYESIVNMIRDVRNEDSHRCNIIEKDEESILVKQKILQDNIANFKKNRVDPKLLYQKSEEEKNVEKQSKLIYFIRNKNYNLVRDTLIDVSKKVKAGVI